MPGFAFDLELAYDLYVCSATLIDYMPLPTTNQVARAANFIYAALTFRKLLNTQTLKPVTIQDFIPLCAWQYERMFNTTRVPDIALCIYLTLNTLLYIIEEDTIK
ncbi:hypothetical protein AVEN_126217-1 [Araneus ventricosus]|uniref:Choline/carnitine acyltransferase domain-containing protein n=1 Tax=Araneus ventricosus TaxID=182803 RepID=A0A4Y2PN03_ARAVE|nr:hypothetical protein AVEN_126217-1 [Araneus ventricosus]